MSEKEVTRNKISWVLFVLGLLGDLFVAAVLLSGAFTSLATSNAIFWVTGIAAIGVLVISLINMSLTKGAHKALGVVPIVLWILVLSAWLLLRIVPKSLA